MDELQIRTVCVKRVDDRNSNCELEGDWFAVLDALGGGGWNQEPRLPTDSVVTGIITK